MKSESLKNELFQRALDAERERLVATWRAAIRKKQDLFEATVVATQECREAERALAAHDQALVAAQPAPEDEDETANVDWERVYHPELYATPPAAPECDDDIHDELCDCNQARPHISRAEGSDLSVDQGREFRVVDGLGDSNRAGKVTIDPTLLSPPAPRSRAEAEAMVDAALRAAVHWEDGDIEDDVFDAHRAALLAALTGEGT